MPLDGVTPIAVVERFLDAFDRHDMDGMLAELDADAYFVPSGDDFAPTYGDFSGHDGWLAWWEISDGDKLSLDRFHVESLDDSHVLAELWIGAADANGWAGAARVAIYTVRDGSISAVEVFVDRDRAYKRARRRIAT